MIAERKEQAKGASYLLCLLLQLVSFYIPMCSINLFLTYVAIFIWSFAELLVTYYFLWDTILIHYFYVLYILYSPSLIILVLYIYRLHTAVLCLYLHNLLSLIGPSISLKIFHFNAISPVVHGAMG